MLTTNSHTTSDTDRILLRSIHSTTLYALLKPQVSLAFQRCIASFHNMIFKKDVTVRLSASRTNKQIVTAQSYNGPHHSSLLSLQTADDPVLLCTCLAVHNLRPLSSTLGL